METNELKQDKQAVKISEHLKVDAMRNAGISTQTRELLIMLAKLHDIENSFCNWKEEYEIVSDDDVCLFMQLTTKCETFIEEIIIKSINDNLAQSDFKEI